MFNKSSHSGSYYYKIWNADLPGLTLTSRVQEVLVYSGQPVRICVEYATGNSQGGYGQPSSNPTMEMYSLQKTWTEIVASCVAENQIKADALKDLAEEKLMESWLEEYYAEFDLGCLDVSTRSSAIPLRRRSTIIRFTTMTNRAAWCRPCRPRGYSLWAMPRWRR